MARGIITFMWNACVDQKILLFAIKVYKLHVVYKKEGSFTWSRDDSKKVVKQAGVVHHHKPQLLKQFLYP